MNVELLPGEGESEEESGDPLEEEGGEEQPEPEEEPDPEEEL